MGFECDLTLVAVMIGVFTCPSPEGEGIGTVPFLGDGDVGFPSQCLV